MLDPSEYATNKDLKNIKRGRKGGGGIP